MSTALVPVQAHDHRRASARDVTIAILCSPVRGRDGAWRVHRYTVAPTAALATCLPPQLTLERAIVNGQVIPPEAYATTPLLAGDELLLMPRWGIPVIPLIVAIAISIAVSLAVTALTYLLFPPAKAHNIQPHPEEPSFSFEGIRTTVGPGAAVPVIYGRQRTGGQLLSASVDQALTVLDNGAGYQRVTAVASPAHLTLLIAMGEGPVWQIHDVSIQINGQPIANFPTTQVSAVLGTPGQAPLPYFGEIANTFADGRLILDPIIYTTSTAVDAFALNIEFLNGLYALSAKGDKVDNFVTIQTRFRVHPTGAWSAYSVWDVVANRTSVVRFGIRREALPLAQYDIELTLFNASATENAGYQPTLSSVTEIQNNVQSYPNTALLGLRAIATDTLQGALPNITVDVYGRTVRVGSFAAAPTYSTNPAWCLMDFLTNTRYGLGIPDSEIDLPAFQTYAAYCDQIIDGELRHELNYTLDRDQRAQVVLMEMLGGSRATLFKSEGLWTPRPTRNDTPVQLLSWASCTDLKLTYTRDPERINVIEARFANEEADFQQDVLSWPSLENQPPDIRKTSLEVRGVTKPTRVMRAMQFELNRRRFENIVLEATFSLEAIVLQPHDLFRFSHPLPGWGTSGRLMAGSSLTALMLDRPVTFVGPQNYVVYVRHSNDVVEMRPVVYPGDLATSVISLGSALSQMPVPRETVWAFGHQVGAADTAQKVFRVVRMQRLSDHRIQIQAVIHNPSMYDEAAAVPLPVTTELFNPLGPPPPLTSLIATELTRVQSSGASLRVINLSWDVAQLSAGFAPYGGAMIQRRTVMTQSQSGVTGLGSMTAGVLQDAFDGANNFVPVVQVSGHVLDWDDFTVITGTTYVYRVIPVSSRGVPNLIGSRDVLISVAGPTTPNYFPGQVRNLRLKGKAVGETEWEGRDIHIEWDAVSGIIFTETFFVQDYIVEVWLPGQLALLHRTYVLATPHQQTMTWTYTQAQNDEDSHRIGLGGPQRTVLIMVWARTNTSLVSLEPAQMTVSNPPPDMSEIIPECTALFQAAIVDWHQYFQPRDFDHYAVFLDTVSPPVMPYQGVGIDFEKLLIGGLLANVTYYVYIWPFDTFGPGIPSQIASFTPVAIDADSLDDVPPAMPTDLVLTTGTQVSDDGTIMPWVQASWRLNAEEDMSQYEVHFRVAPSTVPTTIVVSHPQTSVRLENLAGNVTVFAKALAYDKFHNASAFTEEVSITTAADTVPPAAPSNLTTVGSIRAVALLWTPPADLDYAHSLVYASVTNDLATAAVVGTGLHSFVHEGLGANATWYYWLRAVDTSDNVSVDPYPLSPTGGIAGTAGQLDTTFISSLAVDKLLAGVLRVFVQLGVAEHIFLDGPNSLIYIYDNQSPPRLRVELGKLGTLGTDYGLRLYNEAGQLMWNFPTGATNAGITDNAITATKISAATIAATHLRTDTAVITLAAQIANAIIGDAHITSLAADKILASTIQVLLQLGIGPHMYLDGPNNNMYVYDGQSPPVIRAMFGKIAGGAGEYGIQIWNQLGQLMWSFTDGAQTLGIADLAVTNAKIANLVAGKIVSSAITALLTLSVGPQMFLDGPNANMYVYDTQATPRIRAMFGKIGAGSTDYGLQVWGADGTLMYDFTNGAYTRGIQPFAVTESLQFAAAGGPTVTGTEVALGTVTFTGASSLGSGDEVWLVGMATVNAASNADRVQLRLRIADLAGPILATATGTGPFEIPMGVQSVYVASGGPTTLLFTALSLTGTTSASQIAFTAFRRKR